MKITTLETGHPVSGIKTDSRGFIKCPDCGRITKTKTLPGTRMRNFPLWCSWCKKEFIIDIK